MNLSQEWILWYTFACNWEGFYVFWVVCMQEWLVELNVKDDHLFHSNETNLEKLMNGESQSL